MKTLLFLCGLFTLGSVHSQATHYFKDFDRQDTVKAKKANFKLIIKSDSSGVIKEDFYNLETAVKVYHHEYLNGLPTGIWLEFDDEGELFSNKNYGGLIYGKLDVSTTEIHQFVEIEANYDNHGGLINYLQKAVHYPKAAIQEGIQGIVYVQFIISETGNIENISIVRGVHPFLDYEAFSVVRKMKNWNPAQIANKHVKCIMTIPVSFRLG